MKFSVLMSIYIKENPIYLQHALESIFNQTLIPNELVLVKDGVLTKELDSVIDKAMEKFPNICKIIELKENKGLGLALRRGVEECSHEVIARMDTDDIATCERFEKQIKILIDNDDIDIVGSFITEFKGTPDKVISVRSVPLSDMDIKGFAKKRNPFNHMTVMYRKSAVLSAGNYQEFLWNEDYHLWVRMMINGSKMINIPESLVFARTGSIMFERRGGLPYLKRDFLLQKEFLGWGFINYIQFLKNILIRIPVRLFPNKIRGWFYVNLLRNNV